MNADIARAPRQVAEARRILADAALCARAPQLRRLAFCVLATARGRPCRQLPARARDPRLPA